LRLGRARHRRSGGSPRRQSGGCCTDRLGEFDCVLVDVIFGLVRCRMVAEARRRRFASVMDERIDPLWIKQRKGVREVCKGERERGVPLTAAETSGVARIGADMAADAAAPMRNFLELGACRGILCRKNMGYHMTDPNIRTQGAVRMRSRSQRNMATEASRHRRAQRTIERDTELYPGSGPLL
jgi:hypothetical protein